MLTLPQGFDDESEAEKHDEHTIQFLEAGEDTPVTLKAAEETLDFVALLVERPVMAPGIKAIGFGRDHGNHFQLEHQLTGFVAFVSAIHDHRHTCEFARLVSKSVLFGIISRSTAAAFETFRDHLLVDVVDTLARSFESGYYYEAEEIGLLFTRKARQTTPAVVNAFGQ